VRYRWRFAVNSAVGVTVIALLTFAGRVFALNALFVSCLYLIAVTLLSMTGDFGGAVVASIAAFACLDYFFTEPLYSFRVSDPGDTIALFASLVTALVVTSLASKARREARDARLHRNRLEQLYQLAQQLVAFDPAAPEFLEPFLGVFGITAVCFFDAETAHTQIVGESKAGLPVKTRDAYVMGVDMNDQQTRTTVRRIQPGGKVVGAIGFEGLEEPAFTAPPLAALAATLFDRNRALQLASEAAAATQVEVYRAAVLDALAHEFRTPLTTILAAAGGLQEAGTLNAVQKDMAETVEGEAARLGKLTARLLRTARLESQQIKPRLEVTDINSLIHQIAAQHSARAKRRIVLGNHRESVEVMADQELLRLPLNQLIENACKYSPPGATVTITVAQEDDFEAVRVSNTGSSIPPKERQRIFERFYRGAGVAESTPGSGLGLYVARKIALAHGGTLDLESADDGVTFCLRIPCAKEEVPQVVATR
jgi:two-component system sensor histidine kinase KdpD